MTRRLLAFASIATLALAVAACGEAERPSGSASATPGGSVSAPPSPEASPSIDPSALRFTCGTFPFGPELLTAGPGTAEQADNSPAAALRAHLALPGEDVAFLPDHGWHLAGADAQKAEFVVVGGKKEMWVVLVENGATGWKVANWGNCQPHIALQQGLVAAQWVFDPAQPKPGPTTPVFDAMVTERSCASGKPALGRMVGPQIVKSADSVLVLFATRPLAGAQDCQGNPATRVQVDLGVVPAHVVDKLRALVLGMGLSKLHSDGGLSCSIVRPS